MKYQFIEKTKNEMILTGLVEDDELLEFRMSNSVSESRVGNIYRGRVVNVVNGLKAAFVNIGAKHNAYLYLGDESLNRVVEGQQVIVQVQKDEIDNKGAKVVLDYSIRGNYVVLLPFSDNIKISKKIKNRNKRNALLDMAGEVLKGECGVILRTSSEFAEVEDIKREIENLYREHLDIAGAIDFMPTPKLLRVREGRQEISIKGDIDYLITNDENIYKKLKAESSNKDIRYDDYFSVKYSQAIYGEIKKLFDSTIELEIGAQIVIEKTEAMNVIDVNSNKYFDDYDINVTIMNTNKSAAMEILKQISLRDLSGIIIVDFIDFIDSDDKNEFTNWFREAVKSFENPPKIYGFTSLGLMEMARRRSVNSELLNSIEISDIWQ